VCRRSTGTRNSGRFGLGSILFWSLLLFHPYVMAGILTKRIVPSRTTELQRLSKLLLLPRLLFRVHQFTK
jgi:hypothetical protein